MMEVCEGAGHLTANQVGYNLFDRRMEWAVLGVPTHVDTPQSVEPFMPA